MFLSPGKMLRNPSSAHLLSECTHKLQPGCSVLSILEPMWGLACFSSNGGLVSFRMFLQWFLIYPCENISLETQELGEKKKRKERMIRNGWSPDLQALWEMPFHPDPFMLSLLPCIHGTRMIVSLEMCLECLQFTIPYSVESSVFFPQHFTSCGLVLSISVH